MKKIVARIGVLLLFLFLIMQLYQPNRNVDPRFTKKKSLFTIAKTPKNVENILKNSCTDCHTNNTNYPLYSFVQPIRYFIDGHIKGGKENLNFDEWAEYSQRKRNSKIERIISQIEKDEMPLRSYTLIHRNAILNENQKTTIINYFKNLKNE